MRVVASVNSVDQEIHARARELAKTRPALIVGYDMDAVGRVAEEPNITVGGRRARVRVRVWG